MEAAGLAGGVTAALELLRAGPGGATAAPVGFTAAGNAAPGSVPRAGSGPWNPG
jgi:hypothetical protein